MPKRKWPKVGDRVIVPFGGYGAQGEVVRVEGVSRVWVTVVFKVLPDEEEPTMMTYKPEELRPVETAA